MQRISVFCETTSTPEWNGQNPTQTASFLDVWRIPLFLPGHSIDVLKERLSDEELRQAHRFAQKEDRIRYILGKGLLRKLLQIYLNEDPDALQFGKNRYRKPFLVGREDFHFNSSHAGDWVVIALAGSEVGIDIERVDPRFSFEELLPYIFSSREIAFIRQSARPTESVYTLWTRKEALLKGMGLGITDHLMDYTLLDGRQEMEMPERSAIRDWQVRSFLMDREYCLSLAFTQPSLQPRFFDGVRLFSESE
ncbi:4'-phosphopantetheinyl transferase family protein [Cyclobacterium xiamenense]|uniref:4'-phosphopantetheinyl transferase family protein n=1 Tax=Cyclobacterium xiamenense TaxID=1297121 RepID=UPI0035D09FE4